MNRTLKALIATAIFLLPMAWTNVVSAAPKRVEGVSCRYFKASQGTWIGHFEGLKESPMISKGDQYYPVSILRCFKSQADCKAWKYWVQTDYPIAPRVASCKRK